MQELSVASKTVNSVV